MQIADPILVLARELATTVPADEHTCLMIQYATNMPRWAQDGTWISRYLQRDGTLTDEGCVLAAALIVLDPEVKEYGRNKARETLASEIGRRS